MSLTKEVSDLVMDAELASVFGSKSLSLKLDYYHYGTKHEVSMGTFLKMLAGRFLMRVYHPLRQMFNVFDRVALNAEEKENFENVNRFKLHV